PSRPDHPDLGPRAVLASSSGGRSTHEWTRPPALRDTLSVTAAAVVHDLGHPEDAGRRGDGLAAAAGEPSAAAGRLRGPDRRRDPAQPHRRPRARARLRPLL